MNGYDFTQRVRKVMQIAREEAITLKYDYVDTEHLLLAIIRDGEGVASAALDDLGINQDDLRDDVLKRIKPGPDMGHRLVDLPYTSRAKSVLELAMSAARDLNHTYVGTEHLLIGLSRAEGGIAAQALATHGLTAAKLQDEVVRLLGTEPPRKGEPFVDDRPPVQAPKERQAQITVVIEHPDGRVEAKKFRRSADAALFLNGLGF
jgi:ATP-dependent Clp protease ATP-binding subunit ClpC